MFFYLLFYAIMHSPVSFYVYHTGISYISCYANVITTFSGGGTTDDTLDNIKSGFKAARKKISALNR